MEDFTISATRVFNDREVKLSISLVGGDFLSVLVEDTTSAQVWRFDSSASQVELLTQKTKHPQSFQSFVQLLRTAFEQSNSRVKLELLTSEDLLRLMHEKGEVAAGRLRDDKWYLMLVCSSDDRARRIQYPLPLHRFQGSTAAIQAAAVATATAAAAGSTTASSGAASGVVPALAASAPAAPAAAASAPPPAPVSVAPAPLPSPAAGPAAVGAGLPAHRPPSSPARSTAGTASADDLDRLRLELDETRAELRRYRAAASRELKALKQECEALAADLDAKDAELHDLRRQLDEGERPATRRLQRELSQLEEQLRAQRLIHAKEVKKLSAENKTLLDENVKLKDANRQLSTRLKDAQHDLELAKRKAAYSGVSGRISPGPAASYSARGRSVSPAAGVPSARSASAERSRPSPARASPSARAGHAVRPVVPASSVARRPSPSLRPLPSPGVRPTSAEPRRVPSRPSSRPSSAGSERRAPPVPSLDERLWRGARVRSSVGSSESELSRSGRGAPPPYSSPASAGRSPSASRKVAPVPSSRAGASPRMVSVRERPPSDRSWSQRREHSDHVPAARAPAEQRWAGRQRAGREEAVDLDLSLEEEPVVEEAGAHRRDARYRAAVDEDHDAEFQNVSARLQRLQSLLEMSRSAVSSGGDGGGGGGSDVRRR